MLHWIVWNGTVFIFKLYVNKKLLILNWIGWNGTVNMYKKGFGIK